MDGPDSLQVLADGIAEGGRLDAFSTADDELGDVRTVFSWSYRQLAPDLRWVFRLLGLHPGPSYDVSAAAALMDASAERALQSLRALTDVHLVTEDAPGRYTQHDLLRTYARELLAVEDDKASRTAAIRRLQGWYQACLEACRKAVLPFAPTVPLIPTSDQYTVNFDTPALAMRWFAVEQQGISGVIKEALAAGQYEFAWKTPVVATGLFELGWYQQQWREAHEIGRDAAVALGDGEGRAMNELLLGDVYWRLERPVQAREQYEQAIQLVAEQGPRWIHAFALRGLGLLSEESGDWVAARQHFDNALRIFHQDGHRRGEAMTLLGLSACARAEGEYITSIVTVEKAVDLLAEIDDHWSVAWARISLADAYCSVGQRDAAIAALRPAAAKLREIEDPKAELRALTLLARELVGAGDTGEAAEVWCRIARLYEMMDDARSAAAIRESDRLRAGGK